MNFVYCNYCHNENKNAVRPCICGCSNFSSQPQNVPADKLHFRGFEVVRSLRQAPNMSYQFLGVMLCVPSAEVEVLARRFGLER